MKKMNTVILIICLAGLFAMIAYYSLSPAPIDSMTALMMAFVFAVLITEDWEANTSPLEFE